MGAHQTQAAPTGGGTPLGSDAALIPHTGPALQDALAWGALDDGERKRRAVAAAQAHDAAALWRLTERVMLLDGKRGARISPHTRRAYRRGVYRLVADWRHENLLHPNRKAGAGWVRALEGEMVAHAPTGRSQPAERGPRKAAGVQLYLAAGRALYRALRDARATSADPFADVHPTSDPTPRQDRRCAYDLDDIAVLLAACREMPERLVVLLGAHAGLRLSEMLAVQWSDVDLSKRLLVVRRGKGGKGRTVGLSGKLIAVLESGDVRMRQGPVLTFRKEETVRGKLRALCGRAGVAYRGVHALRHSAGTRLLRETHDLEMTARHLGHSSIETTRLYAKGDDEALRAHVAGW